MRKSDKSSNSKPSMKFSGTNLLLSDLLLVELLLLLSPSLDELVLSELHDFFFDFELIVTLLTFLNESNKILELVIGELAGELCAGRS